MRLLEGSGEGAARFRRGWAVTRVAIGLITNQWFIERDLGLRNGVKVHYSQVIDLAEGMAAGHGPCCRLSIPGRLQIESGWDGAIHLYTTRAIAEDPAWAGSRDVLLRCRNAAPDPEPTSNPVGAVADEEFWAAVAEASEHLALLCECWAYGTHGCRWFRVTRENVAEVARLMRPRSLIRVAVDPHLHPRPELVEDGFTAFTAPLPPGELAHRTYLSWRGPNLHHMRPGYEEERSPSRTCRPG